MTTLVCCVSVTTFAQNGCGICAPRHCSGTSLRRWSAACNQCFLWALRRRPGVVHPSNAALTNPTKSRRPHHSTMAVEDLVAPVPINAPHSGSVVQSSGHNPSAALTKRSHLDLFGVSTIKLHVFPRLRHLKFCGAVF